MKQFLLLLGLLGTVYGQAGYDEDASTLGAGCQSYTTNFNGIQHPSELWDKIPGSAAASGPVHWLTTSSPPLSQRELTGFTTNAGDFEAVIAHASLYEWERTELNFVNVGTETDCAGGGVCDPYAPYGDVFVQGGGQWYDDTWHSGSPPTATGRFGALSDCLQHWRLSILWDAFQTQLGIGSGLLHETVGDKEKYCADLKVKMVEDMGESWASSSYTFSNTGTGTALSPERTVIDRHRFCLTFNTKIEISLDVEVNDPVSYFTILSFQEVMDINYATACTAKVTVRVLTLTIHPYQAYNFAITSLSTNSGADTTAEQLADQDPSKALTTTDGAAGAHPTPITSTYTEANCQSWPPSGCNPASYDTTLCEFDCAQEWEMQLCVSGGACEIKDAEVILAWSIQCRQLADTEVGAGDAYPNYLGETGGSTGSYPMNPTPTEQTPLCGLQIDVAASATITLNSSNYCESLIEEVSLSARIDSFATDSYDGNAPNSAADVHARDDFIQGARMYYKTYIKGDHYQGTNANGDVGHGGSGVTPANNIPGALLCEANIRSIKVSGSTDADASAITEKTLFDVSTGTTADGALVSLNSTLALNDPMQDTNTPAAAGVGDWSTTSPGVAEAFVTFNFEAIAFLDPADVTGLHYTLNTNVVIDVTFCDTTKKSYEVTYKNGSSGAQDVVAKALDDGMSTSLGKVVGLFAPSHPEPILCDEDFHVVNNACIACAQGATRPSGDNALGADTACNTDGQNAASALSAVVGIVASVLATLALVH